MMKIIAIILTMVVCCYCEENNEVLLSEDTRDMKKKRGFRLLAMIALYVLAKVEIFKIAFLFFFYTFSQKLFSLGGVLMTYFMKTQLSMPPPPTVAPSVAPSHVYGPPSSEYNTLGYSYGPPEESFHNEGPNLSDLGGPISWLTHKP